MTTATKHSNEAILFAPKAAALQMIKDNLAISDKWVMNAVLCIYARQTADEQASDTTEHQNGVGFSGADAEILSSFAKQIIEFRAGRSRWAVALTPRQMALARKRIGKYARQLWEAAHAKAQSEQMAKQEEKDQQAEVAEWDAEFDEGKMERLACGIE